MSGYGHDGLAGLMPGSELLRTTPSESERASPGRFQALPRGSTRRVACMHACGSGARAASFLRRACACRAFACGRGWGTLPQVGGVVAVVSVAYPPPGTPPQGDAQHPSLGIASASHPPAPGTAPRPLLQLLLLLRC